MPELPEVEVARRQLEKWTQGQRLDAVSVLDRNVVRSILSSKPSQMLAGGVAVVEALVGSVPAAPIRHGKRLGWAFGDKGLLCHLGMTGHWQRRPKGAAPPSQSKIGLAFGDRTLWLVDTRRFACLVPVDAARLEADLRSGCGPDALDAPLDANALAARVSCRKPIKVALMEQKRLAGLGNIHAAEACFRAKIDPNQSADTLTDAQWAALPPAIAAALSFAIAAEAEVGDDGIAYINLGGPNPFLVYKRTGKPCSVCGTAIASNELNKRSTYWCPTCQPPRP